MAARHCCGLPSLLLLLTAAAVTRPPGGGGSLLALAAAGGTGACGGAGGTGSSAWPTANGSVVVVGAGGYTAAAQPLLQLLANTAGNTVAIRGSGAGNTILCMAGAPIAVAQGGWQSSSPTCTYGQV